MFRTTCAESTPDYIPTILRSKMIQLKIFHSFNKDILSEKIILFVSFQLWEQQQHSKINSGFLHVYIQIGMQTFTGWRNVVKFKTGAACCYSIQPVRRININHIGLSFNSRNCIILISYFHTTHFLYYVHKLFYFVVQDVGCFNCLIKHFLYRSESIVWW